MLGELTIEQRAILLAQLTPTQRAELHALLSRLGITVFERESQQNRVNRAPVGFRQLANVLT